MTIFEVVAIVISFTAAFAYINIRFIRLPNTIGVMLVSMSVSLVMLFTRRWAGELTQQAEHLLSRIDFEAALMHGMLAFLLFAGSLHVNLSDLRRQWLPISALSIVATALSTFAIGFGLRWAVSLVGIELSLLDSLLFGALISPTDPVAVLGVMRSAGAPRELEMQMAGESLFNDGIGVVIFLVMLHIARSGVVPDAPAISMMLIKGAGGGALVGLLSGLFTYYALKKVDNYQVEVLITLALAMGGYVLAEHLHVSAPIAIVVAGILIGNQGRSFAMSATTREHLDNFWTLIDEILNAVLFMLIGLEVLVMPLRPAYALLAAVAVAISLAARYVSVAGVIHAIGGRRRFVPGTITVLSWGGLRGGISVAMALSLPAAENRNLILAMTYGVVVFSVFAQGLTIDPVIRRVCRRDLQPVGVSSAHGH